MSGIVLFNSLGGAVTGAVSVDFADPWAASFSTGAAAVTLNDVKFGLYFDASFGGQANGKLVVSLDSDSSTAPGTVISALGTITHSALPTIAAGTFDVSGFAPVSLAAHTRYWVELTDSDIGVQWTATSTVTGPGVASEFTDNSNTATANTTGAFDLDVSAACYVQGTRILTARGEVPIETLVVGDRVVGVISGRLAAIVWIGHRRIDCRRHADPDAVMPIEIAAGAFGANQPCRTLWLSRDHAVYIDGVLVPIHLLINGTTIAPRAVETVTYWHIELAAHDAVLADGLPAETYLDTGNRSAFGNATAVTAVHPDFSRGAWDGRAAALLVEGGARLYAARAGLRDGLAHAQN